MRAHTYAFALAALLFLICLGPTLSGVAGAAEAGYPRLALYGGIQGIGFPFITGGNRNGPLDLAMCEVVSRHHQVILDASPISEYRPDVLVALRTRNPGIALFAYVNTEYIWMASEPDSTIHYPTRFRRLIRDLNGFLYGRSGRHYGSANVNLAKRDGSGRYVVAEKLADLFYDAIVRTGIWDGMFLDVFCERLAWTQTPADSIDFQRAGYPSLSAFDDAYKTGTEVLANRLRSLVGPTFLVVGNCGFGSKYASMNGWMRENFPYQNGGNWYENMFREPGGYFVDEARFRPPRHNYIFTAADPPSTPYSSRNLRKGRFGLGSATLGEGFGVVGNSVRSVSDQNYMTWWYDEYAVDPSGRASNQRTHTGWLGAPLGPPFQVIWPGSGPDASTNPGFETNVTSGWNFVPGVSATFTRDATTAAAGNASARVSMAVPADYEWRVHLGTTGTLAAAYGGSYSATFWAKANAPRPLPVVMGLAGGREIARRTVQLTTEWKRYQVVLISTATGSSQLRFFLSGTPGDVWLDDVHFQAGVTSVWRRDFQHGAVLVNPSPNPLTVPLGRTYRRIAGLVDPGINDGQTVTQVTVGAEDALFLVGSDNIPPAQTLDMRPVPR